jgi:3-oxoadipate enol-lactonase
MRHPFEIQEVGAGSPVVFLHGCPTPPALLLPLAQGIASGHRALVVALPGYGGTPSLPGAYDLRRLYDALESELLGRVSGEIAIVGFSSGGYHALSLALRDRLRVHTVVSLAGFASFSTSEREALRGFVAAIRAGADVDDLLPARFLSPAFAAAHPRAVDDVKRWRQATTAEGLASELTALAGSEDLRPRLSSIEARVVCRVGELDAACPVAASRGIVASVKRGRLEVVPRAGHALIHEDLDGTLTSLREALARA